MDIGSSQYWAPTRLQHAHDFRTTEDSMRETLATSEILSQEQRRLFMNLFSKYVTHRREADNYWAQIEDPPEDVFIKHSDLPKCPDDSDLRYGLLDKIAILKLNGGVGYGMGNDRAISSVELRPDITFLDLIVKQVEYLNNKYGVDIPLILMNSFKTEAITDTVIRKYADHNLTIHTFTQSAFPKIEKHTLTPLPEMPFQALEMNELGGRASTTSFGNPTAKELDSWYAPGHGDVYDILHSSGLLETLLNQGKEYIYISNIDNVGSTIDLSLLYHVVENEIDFCMCTTKRSKSDMQGGFLAGFQGKPRLVESKQVPKHLKKSLCSRFIQWNTNNLWVNLLSLQRQIARGPLNLGLMVEESSSREGETYVHLQTAAGSAIQCFNKVIAVICPRKFFLPVKTPSDIFLVQSNLYNIRHGLLEMRKEANSQKPPLVKLGKYFATMEEYDRRIVYGVPNILELDHLTVAGNVYFGRDVTLKGTVIIVANEGSVIMIPDGSTLEDKVITGNLSILDH